MNGVLPTGLRYVPGRDDLLLIAPHGGTRRHSGDRYQNLKVNDLYTGEITLLLAERCGASAVVNHGIDRNELDLNRVGQVKEKGPWYLCFLAEFLEHAIPREGPVQIIFLHGWNVVQTACDIGLGVVDGNPSSGSWPTVSLSYRAARIQEFVDACRDVGIAASIGKRYPGSHANNLLQIFSSRYLTDENPHIHSIATHAARGHVEAFQIELGIPLRWPGFRREAFIQIFLRTFRSRPKWPRTVSSDPLPKEQNASAVPPPLRMGFSFHQPAKGIGGLSSISLQTAREPSGIGSRRAGRLLFFLPEGRLALFTGEESPSCQPDRGKVAPLTYDMDGTDAIHVSYPGPLLLFDGGHAFLDLERGLASASLKEADVRLSFLPSTHSHGKWEEVGNSLGRLRGEVCVGKWFAPIDVLTFFEVLSQELPVRKIAAPFGDDLAVSVSSVGLESERSRGTLYLAGFPLAASYASLRFARDSTDTPQKIFVSVQGPEGNSLDAEGEVLTAVPVIRRGKGRKVRVTFGLARFCWHNRVAFGTYEYAVRL